MGDGRVEKVVVEQEGDVCGRARVEVKGTGKHERGGARGRAEKGPATRVGKIWWQQQKCHRTAKAIRKEKEKKEISR